MPTKTQKEKLYRAAIENSGGNFALVARRLGISRSGAYQYITARPDLLEMMTAQSEIRGDLLEDELFKQAMSGNTAALIFMLKTRYRQRGYTERVETDQSIRAQVEIVYGVDEDD